MRQPFANVRRAALLVPGALALAGLVLLILGCNLATSANAQMRDPRAPPGLDPGGVAVALAAIEGIDYLQPQIASRLARDGEGEPIAWDFVDGDPHPYAVDGKASEVVKTLLREAPASRLVYLRTVIETRTLGQTVAFAGQSPARVLVIAARSPRAEDWAAFQEAARFFAHLLIIVPVSTGPGPHFPASLALDNLLTVVPANAAAPLSEVARGPPADIAVPLPSSPAVGRADAAAPAAPGLIAAARVAALAARVLETEPDLAGAALKARVLALAR